MAKRAGLHHNVQFLAGFFPLKLRPPGQPGSTKPALEGTVMKAMWDDFKTFALKGNALDLAIGVIIGAAFSPIVTTLVANIMMPIIGYVTAGVDFSGLAVTPVEGVEIKYGLFLNAIVQFVITAIALFFLIKAITMVRRPAPAAEA